MKALNSSVILLVLLVSYGYSAVIDGPANIREKPNGRLMVILHYGVFVEDYGMKDDWYSVSFAAYVSTGDFSKLPGAEINAYDEDNNQIGRIVHYEPMGWENIEKDRVYIGIYAYTHKGNIVEGTTHDGMINNILKENIEISGEAFYERFEGWISAGLVREYEEKDDPEISDLKKIVIYERSEVSPLPMSIFGFIDGRLKVVGVSHKEFDRADYSKGSTGYYYVIGDEPADLEIQKYISSVKSLFEFRP